MDDILDEDTPALLLGKYTVVELPSTFSITQLGPGIRYVISSSEVAEGECSIQVLRTLVAVATRSGISRLEKGIARKEEKSSFHMK